MMGDQSNGHAGSARDRVRCVVRVAARAGLLALLLAGGACKGPSAGVEPLRAVDYRTEDWKFGGRPGQKLLTENYVVYTTVRDAALLSALPQALESYLLYYRHLIPASRAPEGRMEVFLLAQREEFEEFTRRFGGVKAPLMLKIRGGGYSEGGVSVIQYVSHDATFPLMAHEGFHQFLHHCASDRVPAWLNEGLAVICEGQRWSDSGLVAFDPDYNPLRRNALTEALQKNRLRPLEELLRINAGHVIGGSPSDVAAYYGQVWMLMRFLDVGADGRYAAAFAKLRTDIARYDLETLVQGAALTAPIASGVRPNAGEALFRGYISNDLETVEREYDAFLRARLLGGP